MPDAGQLAATKARLGQAQQAQNASVYANRSYGQTLGEGALDTLGAVGSAFGRTGRAFRGALNTTLGTALGQPARALGSIADLGGHAPNPVAAGLRGAGEQLAGAANAGYEDLKGLGTYAPTDAVTAFNRQTFDRMHAQAGGDSLLARGANAGDWTAHGATQAIPVVAGGGAVGWARGAAGGLTPTLAQAARGVAPVAGAIGINRQAIGNVGLFSGADAVKEQLDGTATLRSRALAHADAEHEMAMQTEQQRQRAIAAVGGSAPAAPKSVAGPDDMNGGGVLRTDAPDGLRSVPPAPPAAPAAPGQPPAPPSPVAAAAAKPEAQAAAA